MHKKSAFIIMGICLILAVSACGSAKQPEKKTLEDYRKVSASPSVYFSSFKKVTALTDVSTLTLTQDAEPDETPERHTAEKTARIYSKNTTTSSVIGEFEDEDEVMVLEKMTGTNWYKIVYNGRVAYVQANVLEVTSDSAGSYNNYIGYSDDIEDFDEAAAHAGEVIEPEEVENGTTAASEEDTDEEEDSTSGEETSESNETEEPDSTEESEEDTSEEEIDTEASQEDTTTEAPEPEPEPDAAEEPEESSEG